MKKMIMEKVEHSLQAPNPLFDALKYIKSQSPIVNNDFIEDYQFAKQFLYTYRDSEATFNAYRREVERLLQWSSLIAKKSIKELRRSDIEAYFEFCQSPPLAWIGTKKAPRFIDKNGERLPNPEWRPFVATVTKVAHRKGKKPNPHKYELSQNALQEIFAILSSFYNFLIQEEYTEVNPILYIRQKNKYFRKRQGKPKIRRLTDLQWFYVIETAELMAKHDKKHERTLFIMNALYAMYLRISELAASKHWKPKMGDFHRDHDGLWWFTTVGKGNKERDISVSDKMLESLKRYRHYLKLSSLPPPSDKTPLLTRTKGKGPIISTTYIRRIVQKCFDEAVQRLQTEGFQEEAEGLLEATVHWLRHTGISDDVKHRPREHVRDDAGHGSSSITDKYIDVELRARPASGKKKAIKPDI